MPARGNQRSNYLERRNERRAKSIKHYHTPSGTTMPMLRTPLQSLIKVTAATDGDLALNIGEESTAEYLRLLVEDLGTAGSEELAGPYFDKILTELQRIDETTAMFRAVCAQEASRLYQVYCLGGDYLLLEQPYSLPHGLFS